MNENDWMAEQFESQRNHLQAVAYRLLGSLSEAEDAVQECWLRLSRTNTQEISNLGGWLTTVVSRVCLDMLRSRKTRREQSIDAQAPETFASPESHSDPEQEALLADSVGLALLVVLDRLNPAERITFVLHDIFAMPFTEIAPIVGKSTAAARQLASRARRRVRGTSDQPKPDLVHNWKLLDAFLAAARAGDFEALVAALAPDVVLQDDRPGTPDITRGASVIAKQVAGRAQAAQTALVNGSAGIVAAPYGKLLYVLEFTVRGDKITEIRLISDPVHIDRLNVTLLEQ